MIIPLLTEGPVSTVIPRLAFSDNTEMQAASRPFRAVPAGLEAAKQLTGPKADAWLTGGRPQAVYTSSRHTQPAEVPTTPPLPKAKQDDCP